MSRLLVLGAAVSGMAAARLAKGRGWSVTVYDQTQSLAALVEGLAHASGEWEPALLQGVDLVVASPGFPARSRPLIETLESGVPLWSEIEFAWRHLDVPVVAVTGTNGKTTVTEATSAMLEASGVDAPATGNIGSPLSDFVDGGHDVLVVEVSSFQLQFTETFHPVAAAVTNVAVDHLDWHGSEASYRAAKSRIFANQTEADLLVYDADDEGATKLSGSSRSRLYPVSGTTRPDGGGGPVAGRLIVGEVSVSIDDLASPDPIHLVDLGIAAALATEMGARPDAIAKAMRAYQPAKHRRQLVLDEGGVRWVDDSKATNPHAAIASIRSHSSVILIAGGLAKGLDVRPLAAEPRVRYLIGIGEAGPALVERAGERGILASTLEEAVVIASTLARAGDTVLLAPGCASFDQFTDYSERGDRFASLALEVAGGRR